MADGRTWPGQATAHPDAEVNDLYALRDWAKEHNPMLNGGLHGMSPDRAMLDFCSFAQKSTPVKPEGKELWSAVVRGGNGKVGRGWTLAAAVLAAVEEPSAADLDVV